MRLAERKLRAELEFVRQFTSSAEERRGATRRRILLVLMVAHARTRRTHTRTSCNSLALTQKVLFYHLHTSDETLMGY